MHRFNTNFKCATAQLLFVAFGRFLLLRFDVRFLSYQEEVGLLILGFQHSLKKLAPEK